jgi:hypothetical protein
MGTGGVAAIRHYRESGSSISYNGLDKRGQLPGVFPANPPAVACQAVSGSWVEGILDLPC